MKDLSPEMENILKELQNFQKSIKMDSLPENHKSISKEEFTLLLSGISTCRKIEGIPVHMGYEQLYFCEGEENKKAAREHLKKTFGIVDKETLHTNGIQSYCAGMEYDQFRSFWDGVPLFNADNLSPSQRYFFEKSKSFAEYLKPFVGNSGLFAWDCNEIIGLCRKACACDIISEDEFWDITLPLAQKAASWYDSWQEYAISCLCGAVYFMYQMEDFNEQQTLGFLNLNKMLLEGLLEEGGAWERNQWFSFNEKNWAIKGRDIKHLLSDWEEAHGCIASDRITVDGCPVGYMYREEPSKDVPDSGWRFFAGDESEEYTSNPDYAGIFDLNTICNHSPDIIPFLHAPYNSAFYRDEKGQFQEEAFFPPKD